METSYNITLIILSYITAFLGSFMSLKTFRDALLEPKESRGGLIFLASMCLGGVGIWSMHFIGMLALTVHGTEMDFNWGLTAVSFAVGVLVVYLGLSIISQGTFTVTKLIGSGFIVGLGVVGMHYTGMLALLMQADTQWNWGIIATSIGIAVAAAIVALWLAIHVKNSWQTLLSAMVMAVAVCGMHYTGMAAADFVHNPLLPDVPTMSLGTTILTIIILAVDAVVVLLALIITMGNANKRLQF